MSRLGLHWPRQLITALVSSVRTGPETDRTSPSNISIIRLAHVCLCARRKPNNVPEFRRTLWRRLLKHHQVVSYRWSYHPVPMFQILSRYRDRYMRLAPGRGMVGLLAIVRLALPQLHLFTYKQRQLKQQSQCVKRSAS